MADLTKTFRFFLTPEHAKNLPEAQPEVNYEGQRTHDEVGDDQPFAQVKNRFHQSQLAEYQPQAKDCDPATATLLGDGRVLFAGGFDGDLDSSAEVFDAATANFRPTGSMSTGRSAHTATLLPDGKVLITGGGARGNVLASAEIYDTATGTFTPTGSMLVPRHKHAAVLLGDGNALVLGGSDNRDSRGQYSSAEIYQTATGTFTAAASMSAARFKIPDAVATLKNGKVLVAGGATLLEIYDAVIKTFTFAGGQVDTARYFSTATTLPDGKVLIVGGYDKSIVASPKGWVYKP